jgi:hypothetical protein
MTLFLHETHEVIGGKEAEIEAAYRDGWMPELAKGDDARLLWYYDLVHGSHRAHVTITVTAVRDAAAWERLGTRLLRGDLNSWLRRVDALRHDSIGRMLLPVSWSKMREVDLESIPADPSFRHEQTLYIEDNGWATAPLDEYIAFQEEKWHRPLVEGNPNVRLLIDLQAFLQVAHGTGRRPECCFMEKSLEDQYALVHNLLDTELPARMREPGTYMVEGLRHRDQWESKIVRTSAWSPLY